LNDRPLPGAQQSLALWWREIELGEHLNRGAHDAERIAQIVGDDAEYVLPRARHHLCFATSIALALEGARPSERASGRLREQFGRRCDQSRPTPMPR
jgi:hypothetical protein